MSDESHPSATIPETLIYGGWDNQPAEHIARKVLGVPSHARLSFGELEWPSKHGRSWRASRWTRRLKMLRTALSNPAFSYLRASDLARALRLNLNSLCGPFSPVNQTELLENAGK